MVLRDSSQTLGQLTGFNALYYKNDLIAFKNEADYNVRVNPREYMYVPPANTDLNTWALDINGRIGQQILKSPPVISRPLNLYENGRDLAIFRKTLDRAVDTSGSLYINRDMQIYPSAVSHRKPVYGLVGL